MTDTRPHRPSLSHPLPLLLTRHDHPGAQAQGCVVALSHLAGIARKLGTRAQHYVPLRLTLANREAIFWSTQPTDLPWLPVPGIYLQPPSKRVFLPIGWACNVSEKILHALLKDMVLNVEPAPPLVLMPQSPDAKSSAVRIILLADSLSVAGVDWALLSRDEV